MEDPLASSMTVSKVFADGGCSCKSGDGIVLLLWLVRPSLSLARPIPVSSPSPPRPLLVYACPGSGGERAARYQPVAEHGANLQA